MPSILLLLLLPPAAGAEAVERRLAAMGTHLDLRVEAADRQVALLASEAAVRAVEQVEARLSTWRPDSELSALNRAPVGTWVRLSPELASDLALAARCHAATGGAFDPAILALVEAWGLRSGGRVPSDAERAEALALSGFHQLEISTDRARRRAPIGLDSGGFGKGIALDAALAAARAAGASAAVVDLGGQVATFGTTVDLDVASPADRGRAAAHLTLVDASAATSGHAERPGHLLDPRTGGQAPDYGSLTVVAPSAAWADCLSTGLYVLGADAARAWAQDQAQGSDLQVIVVAHDPAPALRPAPGPTAHRPGASP